MHYFKLHLVFIREFLFEGVEGVHELVEFVEELLSVKFLVLRNYVEVELFQEIHQRKGVLELHDSKGLFNEVQVDSSTRGLHFEEGGVFQKKDSEIVVEVVEGRKEKGFALSLRVVKQIEKKRVCHLKLTFLGDVNGLWAEERVVDVVLLHLVVEELDLIEEGEKRRLGEKVVICLVFEELVFEGKVEVIEQNALVPQNAEPSPVPLDEAQSLVLQEQMVFLETALELPVVLGGEPFGDESAMVGEYDVEGAEVFVGNGLNKVDVLNVLLY